MLWCRPLLARLGLIEEKTQGLLDPSHTGGYPKRMSNIPRRRGDDPDLVSVKELIPRNVPRPCGDGRKAGNEPEPPATRNKKTPHHRLARLTGFSRKRDK